MWRMDRQSPSRFLHETTIIGNSKNTELGSETRCRLTNKLAQQRHINQVRLGSEQAEPNSQIAPGT